MKSTLDICEHCGSLVSSSRKRLVDADYLKTVSELARQSAMYSESDIKDFVIGDKLVSEAIRGYISSGEINPARVFGTGDRDKLVHDALSRGDSSRASKYLSRYFQRCAREKFSIMRGVF